MAAVPFDTAKFVDDLEAVKIPREQARVIVELVRSSHDAADVATKGDLASLKSDVVNLEQRMETRFAEVKGELLLLKWMLGALVAGMATLLIRALTA